MALHTLIVLFVLADLVLTKLSLVAISQVKPQKLFLIFDKSHDFDYAAFSQNSINEDVSQILEQLVTWECDILIYWLDKDPTLGSVVPKGLDWVFGQVEDAIILEGNCLPSSFFFYFCQTLLERYRTDFQVMAINGDNFLFSRFQPQYSYYFSKYFHISAWATWRRAWKFFNVSMDSWIEFKAENRLSQICQTSDEL